MNISRLFAFILLFSSCLVFSGCTSIRRFNAYNSAPASDSNATEEEIDEEAEVRELNTYGGEIADTENEEEKEIASANVLESETRSEAEILADQQSRVTFPLVYNPMVEKWIHYFQGRGRANYVKWLSRSTRYLDIMEEAIDKYNLPKELVYLSMIESGFNNRAYSHAHAVGMWQFIRPTGRAYGLKIDWWVDERRDPHKSADAAARLLKDLYADFDNWYLAAAAYNAGPNKIRRAIKRYGTNNFWELTRKKQRYLKPETKNYVPKMIAATIIAKNLKAYGFSESEIKYQEPLKHDIFTVSVPIDIQTIAKLSGTNVRTIRDLNPELRRGTVPPSTQNYQLKIPHGKSKYFGKRFASVKHKFKRTNYIVHRVRKGENLNLIARKYGVRISDIRKVNTIRNSRYIKIGQRLTIPAIAGKGYTRVAQASKTRTSSATRYKVRRGDTLSRIARNHGVSTTALKNTNNIRNTKALKVGKMLTIPRGSKKSIATSSSKYRVKRGDTLYSIARKHRMSVAALKSSNNIRNARSLKVGKLLSISGSKKSNMVNHIVKRGESLWEISEQYNVSVKKIQNWNQLTNRSIIKPGQKLKVLLTSTNR